MIITCVISSLRFLHIVLLYLFINKGLGVKLLGHRVYMHSASVDSPINCIQVIIKMWSLKSCNLDTFFHEEKQLNTYIWCNRLCLEHFSSQGLSAHPLTPIPPTSNLCSSSIELSVLAQMQFPRPLGVASFPHETFHTAPLPFPLVYLLLVIQNSSPFRSSP